MASSRGVPVKHKPTLTAEDLAGGIDNSGQIDVILLDFSKAFNKVPHKRLLLKLDQDSIRGKIKRLIEDFHSNRTQQVVVKGKHDYTGLVTSGISDGSVLGPSLFLIYTK